MASIFHSLHLIIKELGSYEIIGFCHLITELKFDYIIFQKPPKDLAKKNSVYKIQYMKNCTKPLILIISLARKISYREKISRINPKM